jgi:lipoprotein signal peptidase
VLALIVLTAITILDRLMKSMVPERSVGAIPGLLNFENTINVNGPLSLPIPATLLIALAIVVGAALCYYALTERNTIDQLLVAVVAVGVLSNAYDRLAYGYVVDTMRLSFGLAFNVADLAIVIGVAVFVFRFVPKYVR